MVTLRTYNSKIPSNISLVGRTVSDIICSLQNAYGELDENILFEVKVILNELLLNAIKHGNCERPDGFVKVAAGIASSKNAFFIIEDEGQGYDYKCIRDKNKDLDCIESLCNAKETGRGILIVENLCEKVKLNKKGNRIIVVKNLSKD